MPKFKAFMCKIQNIKETKQENAKKIEDKS